MRLLGFREVEDVMEDSVERVLIESKRAAEEELLELLKLKEAISVAIELHDQFAERFHLLRNTVSHLCDQKGVKCSKDSLS